MVTALAIEGIEILRVQCTCSLTCKVQFDHCYGCAWVFSFKSFVEEDDDSDDDLLTKRVKTKQELVRCASCPCPLVPHFLILEVSGIET